MSISNGQNANQTNFNNAFVSKTADDTKVGKLTVNKPADGAAVDVQVDINALKATTVDHETRIDTLEAADTSGFTTDAEFTAHLADTTTHGTTGDIVGTSDTQVLTNKDIDGGTASNTRRITLPKDTKANLDALTRKEGTLVYATDLDKVYYDDGATLTQVGSGAGSGGINHISANSDAETSTTGWATYNDTAGTDPVDGTGGIPIALGFNRSTSSPLRSTANFLFDKSTPANAQGDGVSYDFTIARADRFSVHTIKFNYEVSSGTYADNDVTVWIYDVTNSTLIQPVGHQIKNTTINASHQATFQTTSSTSYRLIFHVSSTSALGYALKLDDISVGPQSIARGPMMRYLGTTTNTGSAGLGSPTVTWSCYQRADRLVGEATFTCGAVAASFAQLTIPFGLSLDASKLTITANTTSGSGNIVGEYQTNAANRFGKIVTAPGTSTTILYMGANNAGSTQIQAGNGSSILSTSDVVAIKFEIPILGWSSNQVLSSEESGRLIAARVTAGAATSVTAATTISPTTPTIDYDYTGSYSAGSFTCPEPGLYEVGIEGAYTAAGNYVRVYKNGSDVKGLVALDSSFPESGKTEIRCNAGDVLTVRNSATTTMQYASGSYALSLSFRKVNSTSAQIAASDSVVASAFLSANASASTTVPIPFDTKEFDSHGALTTGAGFKFTAPISGTFLVTALSNSGSAHWTHIHKNGVSVKVFGYCTTSGPAQGSTIIRLLAGEYIDIRPSTGSITITGNSSLGSSTSGPSNVSITRVGNY